MLAGLNWAGKIVALLFVGFIDKIAYYLVALTYNLFLIVSRINIFDPNVKSAGGITGEDIYNNITMRIYTIIGIFVLFVVAYQLILNIVNPDREKSATTKMVQNAIKALIFVILLPMVFNYMHVFQVHVVENGTIPAIILGQNPTSARNKAGGAGKQVALIVYLSFYHPEGGDYSTFYDEQGELRKDDEILEKCREGISNSGHEEKSWFGTKTCDYWLKAMKRAEDPDNSHVISDITGSGDLRDWIDEDGGSEYMWIIASACGFVVAWFFASYTIDIAYRAVKLSMLQIIAPAPLFLRIFPKFEETYDKWKKELIKTYLEIFARLAIIFFIVYLCQMVPVFIRAIFASASTTGTSLEKAFATVMLILGLLKFAKDAPKLFKDLFAGEMFAGLNFKPGVNKRLEEVPLVNKAQGAITGAAGAGWHGMMAAGKGNRLSGLKSGAKYGLSAGFQKGGSQFNAQRQGYYADTGGKGKAGMFGGRNIIDRKLADMKDHGVDEYKDIILPNKVENFEKSNAFTSVMNPILAQKQQAVRDEINALTGQRSTIESQRNAAEHAYNQDASKRYKDWKAQNDANLASAENQFKYEKEQFDADKAAKLATLRSRYDTTGDASEKAEISKQIANLERSNYQNGALEEKINNLRGAKFVDKKFDSSSYDKQLKDIDDKIKVQDDLLNGKTETIKVNNKGKIEEVAINALEKEAKAEARKIVRDKNVEYSADLKALNGRIQEKENIAYIESAEGQRAVATYQAAVDRVHNKGGGDKGGGDKGGDDGKK